MPGSYPAGAPTLSGDLLSVSRFLASPTAISRRLRDFKDLRFVSDQILTGRYRSSGGAVLFEQSEPFVSDRTPEAVSPGSEYPFGNLPTGTAAIAAIQKWGQKARLTEEEILRNVNGGDATDKALRKVVNTVIKQVDAITIAAVASAVTQTQAVTAAWSAASGTNFLRDIQLAKAQIAALNLGYKADSILVGDMGYAYLTSDLVVQTAMRRETTDNPIYTGEVQRVAGLNILVSPNLPAAGAWVFDSTQLGGMADETSAMPGYAVSDMAVQIKAIQLDEVDGWDLQGRRKTVPVVQEPGAAVKILTTVS